VAGPPHDNIDTAESLMRIAVAKGSLLIPPTYFAVAHPLALADRFDFRFFAGASQVADAGISDRLAIEDTVARVLPGSGALPVRRREQIGALLTPMTARAISRFKPDVIHQHFAYGSTAAVRAARDLRIPLVLTVHGGDAFVPLTPLSARNLAGRPALLRMQREVGRAFQSATLTLAVSAYLADVAASAGASRLRVHYQGVDTELFRPDGGTVENELEILFVGRLTETKGVFDLLEASRYLLPGVAHRLTYIGDGPERARLAAAADVHPHIRVLGAQSSDNVRAAMRRASLLVLPTRVNGRAREAAGLVLLEAQASGTPVVAYASGGTPEMMRAGDTGWLVAEGDVASLAHRIGSLLEMSSADRADIAVRARAFVVAERSLARSAEELDSIYKELAR